MKQPPRQRCQNQRPARMPMEHMKGLASKEATQLGQRARRAEKQLPMRRRLVKKMAAETAVQRRLAPLSIARMI